MCAHMCAPVAKKKKIFFFTKCARGAHMCAHVRTENIFFQKKKNTQKMSKKPVFSTPLYFWDLPPKNRLGPHILRLWGGGGGGGVLLCLRLRWQKTGFLTFFRKFSKKKKIFFFSTVCTRARACAHTAREKKKFFFFVGDGGRARACVRPRRRELFFVARGRANVRAPGAPNLGFGQNGQNGQIHENPVCSCKPGFRVFGHFDGFGGLACRSGFWGVHTRVHTPPAHVCVCAECSGTFAHTRVHTLGGVEMSSRNSVEQTSVLRRMSAI